MDPKAVLSLALLAVLLASPLAASLLPAPSIEDLVDSDQNGGPTSQPGAPTNDLVLPDGADDVVLYAPGWKAGAPTQNGSSSGQYDHLDLRRVTVGGENETHFRVEFVVKRPERDGTTNSFYWERNLYFDLGLIHWYVTDRPCRLANPPPAGTGCLYHREPNLGFWQGVPIPRDTLSDGRGYGVTIAKDQIFTELRIPARFGDRLQNVTAIAQETYVMTGGWFGFVPDPAGGAFARDQAPNEGPLATFQFVRGGSATEDVAIDCLYPVRVSNGEATTFVYEVKVRNLRSEPIQVRLSAADIPTDWSVRAPALVKVGANSVATVPVLGGIPFTHTHGATRTFNLTAERIGAEGTARLPLGVVWTKIPQPSAHHQGMLYLHSRPRDDPYPPWTTIFPLPNAWMNGEKDLPPDAATEEEVASSNNYQFVFGTLGVLFGGGAPMVPPQNSADWEFPLSPALLMGLDFNESKPSVAKFDLIPSVSTQNGNLSALLFYCDPFGGPTGTQDCSGQFGPFFGARWNVIALGSISTALTKDTTQSFEVPMTVDEDYKFLKYRYGANIMLAVFLITDVPQNVWTPVPVAPKFVVRGSSLQLSLDEYHDPIDQAFQNVGALEIKSLSPFQKATNPGKTVVYSFKLESHASDRQRLALSIEGTNRNWSRINGPDFLSLEARASSEVAVVVTVPETAGTLERADLYLVAQSAEDPAVVAATRFLTTITTERTVPNEAVPKAGGPPTATPGFEALLVGLALVVLVALLGRRRPLQ